MHYFSRLLHRYNQYLSELSESKTSTYGNNGTKSNSYEYKGLDGYSMHSLAHGERTYYCLAARAGNAKSFFLADSAQTILVHRRKGMIHAQCRITCHACEIAIGIVALDAVDTSIPKGLRFIEAFTGKREYFAATMKLYVAASFPSIRLLLTNEKLQFFLRFVSIFPMMYRNTVNYCNRKWRGTKIGFVE